MSEIQAGLTVLLPCPFCGGEPKSFSTRTAEDCTDTWVECTSCDAMSVSVEGAYADHASAAALWNSRQPCIPQDVLKRAIHAIDFCRTEHTASESGQRRALKDIEILRALLAPIPREGEPT